MRKVYLVLDTVYTVAVFGSLARAKKYVEQFEEKYHHKLHIKTERLK